MLPFSSGASTYSSSSSRRKFVSPTTSMYFRHLVHVTQMDFEYTYTQMVLLVTDPKRVYKLNTWRSQTKAQWARDDPAFVVSLCCLIAISACAYSAAFGVRPLSVILLQLAIFFISGITMASLLWWVSNTYWLVRQPHSVEQNVEWLYAFDVHCNAYFPIFLMLHVLQYFLLPIIVPESFFASLIGNLLYCAAFCYYHYISFLGYLYLPFLNKRAVTSLLYPIAGFVVFFFVCIVLGFNLPKHVLEICLPGS